MIREASHRCGGEPMSPSLTCARCGSALGADARFCPSCGAPVARATPSEVEQRKVVTILFADIAGSTALGERLDPEAVRSLLARHFAEARAILERHGGTVEKFIGDAVMAVFGVPTVHEDDALRAVRAAMELLSAVERTNADPSAAARIGIRTGVNTGEVVAGADAGETLVTGDAVNTAARLQQAAGIGEVLIGATTLELVHDAVESHPVEPIQAKGKAGPVAAVRVLRLIGDVGRRRSDAPMVGRLEEMATLTSAQHEAVRTGRIKLVTVVGPAGVGKSRLVRAMAEHLGTSAWTVTGRCLPYGDGITYWPIRGAVLELAGIDDSHTPAEARDRLAALAGHLPEALDAVATVVGLEAPAQRQNEIFWGIRRVLEAAATRPLTLVLEDLHWAEDTLLELLEYLVSTGSGPILILGTARPDLLDRRPTWASIGSLVHLLGFDDRDGELLLENQLGAGGLTPEIRRRILDAADGNPLFLEEIVAMLREGGALREVEGTWRLIRDPARIEIPVSIRALLGARLDNLDSVERTVLQYGAVVGRTFESAAVSQISPPPVAEQLAQALLALVRRGLLQPEVALLSAGDAYRFRHILIRDAAYESLPKADRARLHEGFVEWLIEAAGARIGDFEEIVAYHFDQAVVLRTDLGERDLGTLQRVTAEWMRRAGERALNRDDSRAALSHFRRAADLGRGHGEVERVALRQLCDLTQDVGAYAETLAAIERLLEIAEATGDEREAATARINRLYVWRHTDPPLLMERGLSEAVEAIEVLEGAGDHVGLAAAWNLMGILAWPDASRMAECSERSLGHARAAGDARWLGWALASRSNLPIGDATPLNEAIPVAEAALEEASSLGRLHQGNLAVSLAVLEAMAGRYDQAVSRATQARAMHREFGHRLEYAGNAIAVALIHLHGDRFELAEPVLVEALEFLESIDERDEAPYVCAWLARCLAWQGRHAEAMEYIERSRIDDADPVRETLCQAARAWGLAAAGDHEASVAGARRAVEATPASAPTRRGFLLVDLAHALGAAGRTSEARDALTEARQLAELKENVGLLRVVARRLEALGG